MKIIIAGAGDVGFHLAKLLVYEQQDIIVIDKNEEVLQSISRSLDVMTINGDAASFKILKEAGIDRARLLIAVTTSEKTNIMTAILAKKLGAKQTVARVTSTEYLISEQHETFRELGVDALISPNSLAANEIKRLIKQCSLTDIFEFEDGKLNLLGITIEDRSSIANLTIQEIDEAYPNVDFKPIAVLRGHLTLIPEPNLLLRRHDHIYFISKPDEISQINDITGKESKDVKNVMINGGSDLALKTARLLEDDYNIVIVENDKERCKYLVEQLHRAMVINANPSDVETLKEEGLERMDAFIALSNNSESNIINSLVAEQCGVYKTIAHVSNADYIWLSQNIGVDTLINEKLIAANNIFRFVRKGSVEAITSLHGVEAEVIEFNINKENRLTKKTISNLHLPQEALIGGVVRGDDSYIPGPDFQLQKDDKVIVFAKPSAIPAIEKLFR